MFKNEIKRMSHNPTRIVRTLVDRADKINNTKLGFHENIKKIK